MITIDAFRRLEAEVCKWGTESRPALNYGLQYWNYAWGCDAVQTMARAIRGEDTWPRRMPAEALADARVDSQHWHQHLYVPCTDHQEPVYHRDVLLLLDCGVRREHIDDLFNIGFGAPEGCVETARKQREYAQQHILPAVRRQIPDPAPKCEA